MDVFMHLGRPSLDALQLTCRRFSGIVAEHLKDCCLRVFRSVCILNLEYARELDHYNTPPVGQVLALYKLEYAQCFIALRRKESTALQSKLIVPNWRRLAFP